MHAVMERPVERHLEGLEGELKFSEPMARHTSWRVGGEAEMYFVPNSQESLVQLMCQLPSNVPLFWFGLGSNLLVRDGGIPGMVVCTAKGLRAIEQRDQETVYAQAGASSAKVARFCSRHGLEGAEFLAGIPGTFGGAVAMNAGAFGGDTWSLIKRIECLDRDGNTKWFNKGDIPFSYRHVELPENNWVIGAELSLTAIKGLDLAGRIRDLLKTRGASQPVQSANAGSVFKNPKGDYAARLLEQTGVKGMRIGAAEYSQKHANFIINLGGARAQDIEALMIMGQEKVKQKFNISLVPEVRIVGEREPVNEAENVNEI